MTSSAVPTPHRIVNPETLGSPSGYAHAMVASPGRLVFLGGQTAHAADDSLPGSGVVEQFDAAAANVMLALAAAGGLAEHICWMQVFTSDARAYLSNLKPIGAAYRRHFGTHYPAMAWFEVRSLFDPAAVVELMCIAVVPETE